MAWKDLSLRGWGGSALVLGWSLFVACQAGAQPREAEQIASAVRAAYMQLLAQNSRLAELPLQRLAEQVGRSNYVATAAADALREGDLTAAERLLKGFRGTADDLASPYHGAALAYAVTFGQERLVSFLLAHGADPDRQLPWGNSALTSAIQSRRWPLALELLDGGASGGRTNGFRAAPLELIVENGWGSLPLPEEFPAVLDKLMERGADPFAPSRMDGRKCILDVALSRDSQLADLLLTNRSSPSRFSPEGDTALHLAALWGRTNVVEFLLASGFSVDQTSAHGLTPLQRIAGDAEKAGRPVGIQLMATSGPTWMRPAPDAPASVMVEMLLHRGATLNVFCAAGLGMTNELAAMLREKPGVVSARDGLGYAPLHYAVTGRQAEAARQLIACKAELDARTSAGRTPLHLAALNGDAAMAGLLLQAGAKIQVSDQEGNTPLHLSAGNWQDTNCLAVLLAAHPDLEATNCGGETALRLSIQGGADNVDWLLRAGARRSAGLSGDTLLHLAAERVRADVVRLLVRRGYDVNARDNAGRTPLLRSLSTLNWETLNALRSAGADLNAADADGNTALHLAAGMNNESMLHLADLSFWERQKQGALERGGWSLAAMSKLIDWKLAAPPAGVGGWTNNELTDWLARHGARPNLTNRQGLTPLLVMVQQAWLNNDLVAASNRFASLLAAGAKVECHDAQGMSCLHWAASNAPVGCVSLLARHVPAPAALRDRLGRSPLHVAVEAAAHSDPQAAANRLEALLAAGFSPNAVDLHGRTPLHAMMAVSAENGWRPGKGLTLALLTNGANPNLQDDSGATPLHAAMQSWIVRPSAGNDLCEQELVLLSHGAKPNLKDRQGRTPMHVFGSGTNLNGWFFNHLSELFQSGWDFGASDNQGCTPLHLFAGSRDIAYSGWADCLRLVLTNTTWLNATNAEGDTPLHVAVRSHHGYTARLFVESGADLRLRNRHGESSLLLAAEDAPGGIVAQTVKPAGVQWGFFQAISSHDSASFEAWLAAEPAIYRITNLQGKTPLMEATERARTFDFAERLLALGAPIDLLSAMRLNRMEDFQRLLAAHSGPVGEDWLFGAVKFQRLEALQALAKAGGDLAVTDPQGHSLLYRASMAKRKKVVKWLEEQGSAENIFDAVSRGNRKLVKKFLDAGTSLESTNRQRHTLLLTAILEGQNEVALELAARGARTDVQLENGWLALHVAAARNAVVVGKVLLDRGADPNALAAGGMGALHIAAAFGNTDFCALLLERGAEINLQPMVERGGYRSSALHWAAHRGGLETVKLLVARGADLTVRNNQSATPADLADTSRLRGWFWFPCPGEIQPNEQLGADRRAEILAFLQAAEKQPAENISGGTKDSVPPE